MDDELELLIARYLDGTASPEEVGRLDERVRREPAACRELFLAADQDVALRELLIALQQDIPVPAGEIRKPQGTTLRLPVRAGTRPSRRIRGQAGARPVAPWAAWGAVAAGLAVFIAGTAFYTSRTRRRPEPTLAKTSPPPPAEVPPQPEQIARAENPPPPEPSQTPPQEPAQSPEPSPALAAAPQPDIVPPAKEDVPAASPATPGAPSPAPAAPKEPAPTSSPEARPVLAAVQSAGPGAFLLREGKKIPAEAGAGLLAGDALQVPARGYALVQYPDSTRLEAGPDTTLLFAALVEETGPSPRAEDAPDAGKRIFLRKGLLAAAAAPQPRERPMIVATPHAEAAVLGTSFTLHVGPSSTRLEVEEGRVRFTRLQDGASVVVGAGSFAASDRGAALAAKPLSETPPARTIEVEQLDSARGVKPANGPAKRLYLESEEYASGGQCVSAPGVGTEVAARLPLAPGRWHLWVRWFDDDEDAIRFEVRVDDRLVSQVAGEGRRKRWRWARFAFLSPGESRLVLRSTYEGLEATGGDRRVYPYAAVTRWDRIVLTRDPAYAPE